MVTKYKDIIFPATTAPTSINWSPGKGLKAKLMYGTVQCVRDGNAANVYCEMRVYARDKTTLRAKFVYSLAWTASQTWTITWSAYQNATNYAAISYHTNVGFSDFVIYEDDILNFTFVNKQAGDVMSGVFKFLIAPINEDFHP